MRPPWQHGSHDWQQSDYLQEEEGAPVPRGLPRLIIFHGRVSSHQMQPSLQTNVAHLMVHLPDLLLRWQCALSWSTIMALSLSISRSLLWLMLGDLAESIDGCFVDVTPLEDSLPKVKTRRIPMQNKARQCAEPSRRH